MKIQTEAYDNLKKSLLNDEIEKYLIGDKEYCFTSSLVEHPTDLSIIFTFGFNQYMKNERNDILNTEINKGLIKLLETPIGTWWVVNILYEYLYGYVDNSLLFKIDIENIVPVLKKKLKNFKEDLIHNKQYTGWRFKNGLWENTLNMIEDINKKLNNEGLSILNTDV